MKYLKQFELFEGTSYDFEESDCFYKKKAKYPSKVEFEFFDKNGHLYVVHFTSLSQGNFIRDFFIDEDDIKPYKLTNFNDQWNILQTVTDITEEFLKKYNPLSLKIVHVGEKGEGDETKRAIVNKRFLERIVGDIGYKYELTKSVSMITKL